MHRRAPLSWVVVLAALVLAAGCGGSSPSSSSGTGSVGIQGVVLNGAASAAPSAELTASSGVKAGSGSITVTIEGAGITTTVSANGTFELKGVPAGTFTLIFQKEGVEIGRVVITASDGAEVKITVQIQSTTLVVVQLEVDDKEETESGSGTTTTPAACIISGGKVGSGIELEGNVSSGAYAAFVMAVNGERSSGSVDVSAASASYKCNGGDKLSDSACKATVKAGVKVHVRGTLMTCTTSSAQVTATEVMVQKD